MAEFAPEEAPEAWEIEACAVLGRMRMTLAWRRWMCQDSREQTAVRLSMSGFRRKPAGSGFSSAG